MADGELPARVRNRALVAAILIGIRWDKTDEPYWHKQLLREEFLAEISARQVARFLMSDSAGMPRPSCSRQIILSVSGRLRLSTSYTRFRLPMKGIRSRG